VASPQPLFTKPELIEKNSQEMTIKKSLGKRKHDDMVESIPNNIPVPYYTKLPKVVVEIQVPSCIKWNLRRRKGHEK